MENPREEISNSDFKDRPSISKNFQVDSEVWFIMIHTYLKSIFENQKKDKNMKFLTLENLASSIGKNIVEKCADDRLGRYRSRQDIVKFIGIDVWTFIFGKNVTKIDSREDNKESYVFIDNDFRFLKRISPENESSKEYITFCMSFISLLIKSALESFSIDSEVNAESINNFVEFTFTITLKT